MKKLIIATAALLASSLTFAGYYSPDNSQHQNRSNDRSMNMSMNEKNVNEKAMNETTGQMDQHNGKEMSQDKKEMNGHHDKNHGDKHHSDKHHGDKHHGDKHHGDKHHNKMKNHHKGSN